MPKYASYTSGAPWQSADKFQVVRAGVDKTLTVADLYASPTFTGTFNASGTGSRGAVETQGSWGGAITLLDTARGGIWVQNSGTEMWLFTGMTAADTAQSTSRMMMNPTGVGIGVTATHKLHVGADDAAKPSTNTWTISSDARLKENVVPADTARCYEIVKSIPLKRYTWRGEVYSSEQVSDRSKLGWIAQDVQPMFPKAVTAHPLALQPVEDGTEEIQEQIMADEEVATTFVEVVDGVAVVETKTETVSRPQFDMLPLVDEAGQPVMGEDGKPATYAVPRMRTVQRPKQRIDTIDDCLSLNADQIYAAMYGAVQHLIAKVEALEAQLAAKA
jgi:hypothetical protein